MIQKFVDRFMARKGELEAVFKEKHPGDYKDIVTEVIKLLQHEEDDYTPDPKRITQIDHGDYQGTLLFVVAADNYQPSNFWYVKVAYGSCSGCDTLQDIRRYDDEKPIQEQVAKYMTLALHVVQQLKPMQTGDVYEGIV